PVLSPGARRRLLAAATIALAACGLVFLALSGSTPFTTNRATPTLRLGAFVFATQEGGAEVEATVSARLAPTDYEHPTGAFAVRYPEGWQIDESDREALFTGPDDQAEILIRFDVPAGKVDLKASLQNWAAARYGSLPDFTSGKQIEQADGSLLQLAAFTGDDEIHRAADTFAEEHEGVIFVESFVAVTGLHDAYLPLFVEIANSFQHNAHAARAAASAAGQLP
ncbi:MAG: hypothetical protein HY023_10035, partial [Chloroflexi bacterium]|nr:hypothetical protein [Chloroflexota bacterium]